MVVDRCRWVLKSYNWLDLDRDRGVTGRGTLILIEKLLVYYLEKRVD